MSLPLTNSEFRGGGKVDEGAKGVGYDWRIAGARIAAQEQTKSGAVMALSIGTQHAPEMPLVMDHDMIGAFPSDVVDETFVVTVLQGGLLGCLTVANVHRSDPAFEDFTIGTVPATNGVSWCAVPTHSFGESPGDLFC